MKWMECREDKYCYFVSAHTLNKMKNYRNVKLHSVRETKQGYEFVFSYKFFDQFAVQNTGYKTLWQDRDNQEAENMISLLKNEFMDNQPQTVGADVL